MTKTIPPASIVAALVVCLGGCGVLLPEAKLAYSPPLAARTSMADAYSYSENAKSRLFSVGSDNGIAQSAIAYGSYFATATGAGLILFSAPANAIKGAALGAGAIVGLDYVASPRARRQIVDQGVAAINCIQTIALNLNAAPKAFGEQSASTQSIADSRGSVTQEGGIPAQPPVSALERALMVRSNSHPPPVLTGQPTVHQSILRGSAFIDPSTAANSLRGYANSLLVAGGTRSALLPVSPGVTRGTAFGTVSSQQALLAAGQLMEAANVQEGSMDQAAQQAVAASGSAPLFLVNSTQEVLNLVINDLHNTDRAASDIESRVRSAVNNATQGVQTASSNASAQSAHARNTVNNVSALTGAGGLDSRAGSQSSSSRPLAPELDTPPDNIGGQTFPAIPGTKTATVTAGDPSTGTSSASTTTSDLATAADITATIAALVTYSKACESLAPGGTSSAGQ